MKALGVVILVVDDHRMVCELLADMMQHQKGVHKVLVAFSALEALELAKRQRIDIALIDARMPGMSGLDLMPALRELRAATKVVAMTSFDEDETLAELLRSEPDGILLKRSTGREEIRQCLEQVLKGVPYLSPGIQQKLTESVRLMKSSAHLTKRELEVLLLICNGHSSKAIAHRLQLKEATVEDYRKEMLRKTAAKNVAELVSYAHRNGLL